MMKKVKITAHVPEDYHLDLVDLGICKLHLECGLEGRFEWGNGGKLCRRNTLYQSILETHGLTHLVGSRQDKQQSVDMR